jgi:hypothetical protein
VIALRLGLIVIVGVVLTGLAMRLLSRSRPSGPRPSGPRSARPGGPAKPRALPGSAPRTPPQYDWERPTHVVKRRLKGINLGPDEDRAALVGWLEAHVGVEAYMEPRTAAHPLSVVLVAGDGEWRRFPLADDFVVRELTRTHGLRVLDAARVGYPARMREYTKRTRREGDRPDPVAGDEGTETGTASGAGDGAPEGPA